MTNSNELIASKRRIYISLAVLVFVLGIVSRLPQLQLGNLIWDKYLGDALYAVLFYLSLAILWPTQAVLQRVIATVAFVVCIECFQITGIPMQMRKSSNAMMKLISVVLGTKFGWGDMVAYFVGLASIVGLDHSFVASVEARANSPVAETQT